MTDALAAFSPATREWFHGAFPAPTESQVGAWEAINGGEHALVVAPTGSGKTLAAFLSALDRLATSTVPADPHHRCRVLYVSPMKALAVDVERNLRAPLAGIRQAARRLGGAPPEITVGIRTGDTPADQRRAFARKPPDVLVTTPESLFLVLTSAARESLRGVDTVIVDEVHAVAGTKRGAHLALSLERLDALLERPAQRIGLSATVRPVEEVGTFLAGGRAVRTVQPPNPKQVEVSVEVPVEDMSAPEASTGPGTPDTAPAGGGGDPGTEAEPRASIWPALQRRVVELIRHRNSTIVFANSRRLAERLTAGINEIVSEEAGAGSDPQRFPAEVVGGSGITTGAAVVLAKAHHGSMSKQQRSEVEEELKSGRLACVVATSSLELGIDMGAVDLVVQVETPPSVASGMQRVGRGGHQVGAVSRGVVFPKFRGDLVGCAVVSERMREGLIESLSMPRNPLDVLAQQVVAMVAMETWDSESLAALVRRAAPFTRLPDSALHAVLDMLAGRYPSAEFGELRARIVWDRVTGELRARPGAQRLAVTSGGTIPDRGLFTVATPGDGASGGRGGVRVGELDEEMVYESRVGDTFLLGTSSWKVTDITHDRVVVVPAPGQPARMPFWKGDSPGRPLELGRAMGAFVRELSTAGSDAAGARIERAGLDSRARENLLSYVEEQRRATGRVPDDRTIVVERFRDELGDWRMVVHSPFGAQVNAPWALVIGARLRQRRGIDPQVVSSDDGIVLRLADALDESGAEVLPTVEDLLLEPDEVQQVVGDEIGGSALFASRFRECAARALLLPRRDPRRRSPLWQQRQRAAQLLEVASQYERFPIVLEAMRECVQDVYDVPGLAEVMSQVASRRVRVVEVETTVPSPFARTLLFGYIGMFLYEADAPLAERRSAALSLDSTLLAELLGSEALRELLDPQVVTEVEARLQRLEPSRQVRDVEGTVDLLHFVGDLSEQEAAARGARPEWLRRLESQRRVLQVRIAGEPRWIPVEDAGRVRDALGVALPVGVPEVFTEPVADPLDELLIRYARCRGPFSAEAVAHRFGIGVAVAGAVLDRLTGTGRLVRGELRPLEAGGGRAPEYCDAEVLRRLRRASLARLRAEIEPVEPAALGRFLPAWHGVGARLRSAPTADDVLAVVEQLAGVPMPAGALESLILPSRLPGYTPALLDELTSTGEVTWVGSGSPAGGDGWVALAPSDVAEFLLPDVAEDTETTTAPLSRCLLSALGEGALFFRQLADRAGALLLEQGDSAPEDSAVVAALWDLVWAGLVTNDTLAPLRARVAGHGATHKPRRSASRGRYARLRTGRTAPPGRSGPPTVSGRWSLAPRPSEEEPTRRAHARAEAFLERHGVLTRGSVDTERVTGGFAAVYTVLRRMEESGHCRRGYVIEGLGPAQFAVPGAIDRLRALSLRGQEDPAEAEALVLAAADPAQPYGAALGWPAAVGGTRHRPGRKAGALVVLVSGRAVLYLERGGKSLLSFTEDEATLLPAAEALANAVRDGWLDRLTVQRADGHGALESRMADILTEAGFRPTPKGLRLRA
nr:ATP-dependent helicase [Halopolyspora algeriensis]